MPSQTSPVEETEQRLMPAPVRGFFVALALIVVACALLAAVSAGGWLSPGLIASPPSTVATDAPSPVVLLGRLLLAVAVIGGLATLSGALVRRIGQPAVVGEIMAGLLLGPSVLGSLAPTLVHVLFPPQVTPYLNMCAQVGLAIFMFTVGSEFELGVLRRQRTGIGVASLAMMLLPFALGVVAAIPLYSSFAGPSAGMLPFAVFIGTALSVTAFPVLARIVQDSGLRGTRLGALAMLCAAVVDVLAWSALAVVLAMVRAEGSGTALRALALTVALSAVCLLGVRPMLRAVATRWAGASVPGSVRLLLVLALIIGLAAATDRIGVHAIFGGFLAGMTLRRGNPLLGKVAEQVGTANRAVLVPVFFASIGMQINVQLAIIHPVVLTGGAMLLLAAIVGKFGSAVPVGWAGDLPLRSALGLGVLMNARGITEIVVLSTGLAIGVINPGACAVLVVMALLTTVMVTPALRMLGLSRSAGRRPANQPSAGPLTDCGGGYDARILSKSTDGGLASP